MKNKYFLIFFIIVLLISVTGCVAPPIYQIAEWTIMVYLDADNNLEGAGIDDINEMEMVGSTYPEVNILVQVDRIPFSVLDANNEGWADDSSNNNWTTTRRYYVTQDLDPVQINSQLISDLGEKNMGDPQTLIDFASWAINNYPAKKYLLVIWNHGGGFRSQRFGRDIAWDDTSGGDKITIPELKDALSAISTQMGKNIDIVGMDACLMAMTEVAYQIRDYTDILVASEEEEPVNGWPYDTILHRIAMYPPVSAEQLAFYIPLDYINSYSISDDATQSAIDLSYMDSLANQLSDLAMAIINDSITPASDYIDIGSNSQHYDGDVEYIDLYYFCGRILIYCNDVTVRNISQNIRQTLDSAILCSCYSNWGLSGSQGLSIYFPYNIGYDSYYDNTNFAQDTFWDEMLLHLGL